MNEKLKGQIDLARAMRLRRLSAAKLGASIDVSPRTVRRWAQGAEVPEGAKAELKTELGLKDDNEES